MKKIYITGSFGNKDIGDDAMLTMHLRNLCRMGVPSRDIILIGHQPNYMVWYFNKAPRECLKNTANINFNNAKCLIVTGGGTINTRKPSGASLKRMQSLVMPFKKHNIPIFMSGQTIGPLGIYPEHDAIAKELLESVDVLTTRDKIYSKEYIDTIGANIKELYMTCDDAFGLYYPKGIPKEFQSFKNKSEKLCAFNITDYIVDTPQKITTLNKIINEILDQGYNIVLIPHAPKDERFFNIHIRKNNSIYLQSMEGMRGRDMKAVIANCDIAIGGRYHFLVFALSLKIPCIGLAGNKYSYIKQHGCADQIGLGNLIVNFDESSLNRTMETFNLAENTHIDYELESESFNLLNKWYNKL
jgi:polysaccharide pyruvyl transferase WcaK-like protein